MPDSLFTTDAMRAVFSSRARIGRMLDFEAALARAAADASVIPRGAAEVIARHCDAAAFDIAAIERGVLDSGNLAIPLVSALTRNVGAEDDDARRYVHWGATSQDVIDTGLVLQLRDALALIEADVDRLAAGLALRAREHADTLLAGRTWLQHALPITLGLKLAGFVSALDRHRERIAASRQRGLTLQFGGAAGTLASLEGQGLAIAEGLATRLALPFPDVPWHAQRDRFCEVAASLGMLTATLGKLGRDLALLAQTEVGEAREPAKPGRGGSSTMPQKRNPVGASIAIAASIRAPGLVATMLTAAVQEHERGLGNWPAEWETLPEIALLAAGSLGAMIEVVAGLDIDAGRMRSNLDLAHGLIFAEAVQTALAPVLGRESAHALVEGACRRAVAERVHLRDILSQEQAVSSAFDASSLDRCFDPERYLGESRAFIARALARHPATERDALRKRR